MNPTNGAGTPQAGDQTQAPGQAPTTATANTTTTSATSATGDTPQAGGTPANGQQSGQQSAHDFGDGFTRADAERIIAELRKENASHRTRLQKIDDANLSDLQKAQRAETEAKQLAETYRAQIGAMRVQMMAQSLGFIDPADAATFLAGKLEYDESGAPKNAKELLEKLAKDKAYLIGNAGQQTPAQAPTSSANRGNAGRDQTPSNGPVFRTSQLADFNFYTQHEAEIKAAMRDGRIIKDS